MTELPNSIVAEQSVLGSVMIGANIDTLTNIISADDFYRTEHRLIFASACMIAANGGKVDLLTLSQHLESKGELEQCGGLAYLAEITRDTPSSVNAVAYAAIIKDRSNQRALHQVGSQIVTMIRSDDETADKIAQAQSLVLGLDSTGTKPDVEHVSSHVVSLVDEIDNISTGKDTGSLSTGFRELDGILKKLKGGHVHIIAGRPACGKTTLGVNIIEKLALSGVPALMFSLEMPARELTKRLVSSIGKVPVDNMDDGMMSGYWDSMTAAVTLLKKMPLSVCDKGGLTISRIRSIARFQQKQNGIKIILIDYIGLIRTAGDKNSNRAQELGEVSRQIKEMAKELYIPVIVLAQLNRGIENRADKTPTMADLRDSGEIEQDADTITFLYRARDATGGITHVTVEKNRHGRTGRFLLQLKGSLSHFVDCEPESYQQPQQRAQYP